MEPAPSPSSNLLLWLHDLAHYPLFELDNQPFTAASVLKLLLLLAVVILFEHLVRRLIVQRVLQRTHLAPAISFAIARIGGYVFIALGVYVALKLVGIDLSSLAVVAGALGVGLGFGLQNIVSNLVSGIIILAERPIAIGDRVEVDDVAGQVARINLRSTVIITNDNISVIVPNSSFISEPVVNWSHGDPKVRINLKVGVAYGSDVPKLKRVLLEVAAAHPKVLADPPPAVFFLGFGDNALEFELGVWTAEMSRSPKRFRSDLFFGIEQALRDHEIEIPFPQRDLHLRSGELPVRLLRKSE